jgi:probable rRNA maturation factor
VKIQIFNHQRSLSISIDATKTIVSFFLKKAKVEADEVSIHFVSQKKICSLHQEFFNDPSPTDCITFPIDDPTAKKKPYPFILGEVFICAKTAVDYAKEHKIDPYEELLLYLVHGLLHLLRYEDQTQEQAKVMRKKEKYYMSVIKQKGLTLRK